MAAQRLIPGLKWWFWFGFGGIFPLLAGCAHCEKDSDRPFVIRKDSFAYANELVWNYEFSEAGDVVTRKADPPPEYSHHCFPMSRAARAFFHHARFDPAAPVLSETEYKRLIQQVVRRDSRCVSAEKERIVIPGFANLHDFSKAHGALLKEYCGGAWRSYVQRGNWRMIFPISRGSQERMAEGLARQLRRGQLPIVHLFVFPQLTVNHAILLYAAENRGEEMLFHAYDPNSPERPAELKFDRSTRRFVFERNNYFKGGAVDVYEIYRNAIY